MEEFQDLNEMTPSKLNELIEKQQQVCIPPKGLLKASLFVFIGTLFSLVSEGKIYFLKMTSTSYVTEVNIPFSANFLSYLLLFLCSSIYIKFSYQKFTFMTIIISVLYAIVTITLIVGFGTTSYEFSHLISTWLFLLYIICFFILERNDIFQHSVYLYIGLAVGIVANSLELLFTFLDVRTEIDSLRTIFTDKNVKNNLLSILNAILLGAVYYLIEKYCTKKEQIIHLLPYFSGTCCIINLIAGIIALEFNEIKNMFSSDESSQLILIVVGCAVATSVLDGMFPFLIRRCSSFALIVCLNFRLFWRYIYILIKDDETYQNLKKYLAGHCFCLFFFLISLFIICYYKLKDEEEDEEQKIMDDVNKINENKDGLKKGNEFLDSSGDVDSN